MKKEKTWRFKEQNKSLRGDPGCPAGWPTHLRRHGGPKHNTAYKNLQTINRNSRNPSLIWLAPQVVTSCLRTGYCGPQRRSWDFHFKWNNGQLHRSPKPRGRFFPFLSFFLFFIFYLAVPGGKSELHGSRQWGLLSQRLRTEMGAIRNSPCLSSHDSMRALCATRRAVLFLSIHVVHRRERPGYTDGWRPAFTHSTRQHPLQNSEFI